jgi:heptosyltransferase-3
MFISAQHKIDINVKKILVIQLGDIGDVVWTWPSIYAIKAKYPGAKISLLTRRGRGSLLEKNPLIEEIIEITQPDGNWLNSISTQIDFLLKLRNHGFDLVIDLRADDRGAILTLVTGARMRYAVVYRHSPFWRNSMFTHMATNMLPGSVPFRGPAEQSLGVLRPLGIDIATDIPRFPVPEVIAENVEAILKNANINLSDKFVTVSPYSRCKYKEWDQGKWTNVICRLWNRWRISTVIVGGIEDRKEADELKLQCGSFTYNLAGKTTLAELAGVINRSILHLGIDTAGPHLAAALGLPTVTIYGPSFGEAWAHPGPMHQIVFPDRDCVPCRKIGCDGSGRSECLEELQPDKVQQATEKLLMQQGLISSP